MDAGWLGSRRPDRASGEGRFRRVALAALAVGLALRVVAALATPTFHAPDEHAHVGYVRFVYRHGALPTLPADPGRFEYEFYQPPLYYLLLVPVYAVVDWAGGGLDAAVRALRFVSVGLWTVAAALAAQTLARGGLVDPGDRDAAFVRAAAVAPVALLPSLVLLSSAVNNDWLLFALAVAAFSLLARDPSGRRSAALGLVVGAALLTKYSGGLLAVAVPLSLGAGVYRGRIAPRAAIRRCAVAGAAAAAIASPWYLRNLAVYGTPAPAYYHAYGWSSPLAGLVGSARYLTATFWAAAGASHRVTHPALVAPGVAVLALAAVGAARAGRSRALGRALTDRGAAFALAGAAVVGVNVALVVAYGLDAGQAQGRYLYPTLLPAALLLALGLRRGVPPRFRRPGLVVGGFAGYALAFLGYSLIAFGYP